MLCLHRVLRDGSHSACVPVFWALFAVEAVLNFALRTFPAAPPTRWCGLAVTAGMICLILRSDMNYRERGRLCAASVFVVSLR